MGIDIISLMGHPDNQEEIEKIHAYVTSAEAIVNELQIMPRDLIHFPFDCVALEIVSKGFALSKACLTLLDTALPDEAYGLSRTLVECTLNLRYLTQDLSLIHDRTKDFTKYVLADKSYWLHWALQQSAGKPEEQEIKKYAQELGVNPDTKAAFVHWSGVKGFVWAVSIDNHPLDDPATTEAFKKLRYAVDYFQTSLFVHCSQPALDNYCPPDGKPFVVSPSSGKYKQPSQSVLFIILVSLHSIIAYALFGMNLERPAELQLLFDGTLSKMKPVPKLHS